MCLFICALWSPAEKGLTSWLSFVVSNCEFVTFQLNFLGQVWYLIASIPDLCTLTYFETDAFESIRLQDNQPRPSYAQLSGYESR